MIFEIAQITVQPGKEQQFENGVREAIPSFQRARGCKSMQLQRSIEQPNNYTLVVGWDSIDDHMTGFRNSDDFQEWRRLVGPYFLQPPKVHHVDTVLQGF
jgi:heme-degrading monooxygenase HmoA